MDKSTFTQFLDNQGKVTKLPRRQGPRYVILKYLCDKLPVNVTLSESNINDIIIKWHTFGDYATIRREMYEAKLIDRSADCTKYIRTEMK